MDFGKLWRTGPAPVSASLGGYDPVGYRSPALSQGMFGGILSKLNPFPEGLDPNERSARSDALIQLGLGILQGNTGHFGAAMPAIAAGGIAGFQGYKNALREQGDRRLRLLQEKLVGSQIAENDSQALLRNTKIEEENRLRGVREKIIADMDAEFGGDSSERNSLYDSGLPPGEGNQATAPGIAVRPTYWASTPEGNQTAAIRLMKAGARAEAKEFFDRAKELQDAKFKNEDIRLREDAARAGKYKQRNRNIAGGMFVQEESFDGGMTWKQIPGSEPASIRDASGGTSVSIPMYEPASKAAQGKAIESLQASYDKLANAPATIANLRAIKAQAAQLKNFSGSLADKKIAVAKFLNNNFGTSVRPEELANAESINTRLFLPIMDNLKAMDSQPSQLQQQMMREAFGNILTDPNALPMIADIMEQNIREKVNIHNKKYKQASGKGITFPYDLNVDLPGKDRTEVKRYRYQGKTVIEYDDGSAEMDGKPVKIK